MIAVYVVLGIVALFAIGAIASYNRFARQVNLVKESWRQIDVELTRRHDLIPNLVATVKGYAAHEQATLERVTALRGAAVEPTDQLATRAAREDALTAGVDQLFAVAEAYPSLQADRSFHDLQRELVDTEDRIASSRRLYNGNVRALNTRIEAFPSSMTAKYMHVEPAEYFEASDADRTVPKSEFA